MAVQKRGLGKGLGALISTEEKAEDKGSVIEIDINKIEPNKDQPRKNFNQDSLNELAESIKEFGVIQPLILNEKDGYYTIVAGERRWRAARIAKLNTVPAIIRNYGDLETLQIALIENIQREDLNPIEEALCYQKLIDIFFFKKEDIAAKVGKSRNTIGSMISLLSLDPRVQNFITEGRLLIGHGRRLLDISDNSLQFEAAERIMENELSVKEAGLLIDRLLKEGTEKKKIVEKSSPLYARLEDDLKNIFGTKVNIKDGKNKGKIEIEYYSEVELDRLMGIFKSFSRE